MLIKLHSVVVVDEIEVCGTYKEVNEPVILWSEAIVDKLGRLRGPAGFVANDSTEVYVRRKTQRSFWSYGTDDKSGSTDGQSQRKFEDERTRTSFGDWSFPAAGPRIWNSLPPELRWPDTELGEFRRLLKTFLFA